MWSGCSPPPHLTTTPWNCPSRRQKRPGTQRDQSLMPPATEGRRETCLRRGLRLEEKQVLMMKCCLCPIPVSQVSQIYEIILSLVGLNVFTFLRSQNITVWVKTQHVVMEFLYLERYCMERLILNWFRFVGGREQKWQTVLLEIPTELSPLERDRQRRPTTGLEVGKDSPSTIFFFLLPLFYGGGGCRESY